MTKRQSKITSFLTLSTSSRTPPHEDSTQHLKNDKNLQERKLAHYIEGLNDNSEPVIACQVIKEDGTKFNVKLKITKAGKQFEVQLIKVFFFRSNNLIY